MVYICEIMIDTIKHSFIAKFNDIKPIAFSEFLEDLCRQVFILSVMNFLLLRCAGIKIILVLAFNDRKREFFYNEYFLLCTRMCMRARCTAPSHSLPLHTSSLQFNLLEMNL